MTAMFPDSGVPPQDARNTLLDPNTINCDELWYSTSRCQPRFDPAAANAMLSELINAINCAGLAYDCSRLDNLCRAIQTMIQGGDSWCAPLSGGPNDYSGALHPTLLAYPADCCMALKLIPNVNNAGAIRLNIDNLGWIPVVRNDGTPMQKDDWIANIPQLVVYCNGRFVQMGIVPSQLPSGPLDHQIDLWVNNAYGSDDPSHDGLSDTPAHALATLQRAIDIAFGYSPGPYPVVVHIMAGTYAGGNAPEFPGPSLHIIGQGQATIINSGTGAAFTNAGPNNARVENLAVKNNAPFGSGGTITSSNGSSITVDRIYAYNVGGAVVQTYGGSMTVGAVSFYEHAYCLFWANYGGNMSFGPGFSNCNIMQPFAVDLTCAFVAGNGSVAVGAGTPPFGGKASLAGTQYLCALNGVVQDQTGSVWFAGNQAGSSSSGGQYLVGS